MTPSLLRRTLPAALLALSACATSRGATSATPLAAAGAATATPIIRVFDTRTNAWTTFGAMVAQLARADMVFFGEQHNDPDTHATELAVLAALGDRREHTVLSLEMFERDVQPLLNQYLAGAANESTFVAGSRPWAPYRTDYRAMVELARVRGWPVVAANIPRRIASAVSRGGLRVLDTLSQPDRGYAAAENLCPRDGYYAKFAQTMQGHGPGGASAPSATATASSPADLFYESQCTKDEAMAESIVRAYRSAGQKTLLLHVNGAFHSDGGLGTVSRVKRRLPKLRVMLISALPVANIERIDVSESVGLGDFLVYTRQPR